MKTKDGDPVPGKRGLVYFNSGTLPEVEYKKWLKEQAKVTVVSIEDKQKAEFKELVEKSKTEKINKVAFIAAFETDLKRKELAAKYGVTVLTVDHYCQKFFQKSFKSAKQAHLSRKAAIAHFYPETVKMPLDFDDRILGTTHEEPRNIADEDGNYVDIDFSTAAIKEILNQVKGDPVCAILSNEVASGNWRGYLIEPNQTFHETVLNLPYYAYNPVKRLRRAALSWLSHGDFERLLQQKEYFGESIGLFYLKVRFAKTHDELYLTHDGGLIISEKASTAMSYNFVERDQITDNIVTKMITSEDREELETVVKTHPPDKRIEAGESLTKTATFPTDGYMLNPKIRGRKHFSLQFNILKHGQISVGDKLLGLTGLKGIVCKVDPAMKEDIIINPNQVYGEKETRKCGAAIKEIQKTGRIAVFYQPRQLASSRFSAETKRVTISCTTYPFIALYGSKELQSDLLVNHQLADLFYMFDLVLDEQNKVMPVNRQVKARQGGIALPFGYHLWNKNYIKTEIWFPNWLPKYLYRRRKGSDIKYKQETQLYAAICRIAKISELPSEKVTESQLRERLVMFEIIKRELVTLLNRNVAPEVKKGRSNIIAVAKLGNPDEIELTRHDIDLLGLKPGNRILVRREPVVSKNHIQEFVVKLSEDRFQQNNTVKIAPEAIRLMLGDIDGDPLIFMCYSDENFRINARTYETERKRLESELMEDFDLSKIDAEKLYKTDNELLNLAETEHKKLKTKRREVPYVGGLRRGASIMQNSREFEKEEIVDYAIYLEEDLKDVVQPGKFASEKSKEEQLKVWHKAAKGDCVLKLLWKKYEEGKLKGSLLDKILGTKFLTDSDDSLYQDLIAGVERAQVFKPE